MENKVLRIVFTIFVGALLALFVGFGIHTFDPPPDPPDTAHVELKANPTDEEVAQAAEAQRTYDLAYQKYSRAVSIMSMSAAVLFLVGSLLLERRNRVMANGILLGGLFTLVYGVGRGFASRDTRLLFVALTVALAIVLFVGFRRFRPSRPGADRQPAGT